MDLVERIGPLLGIAAFLGLAMLGFLLFQQARDIRRLRDWAGRAPERAREAAEASLATVEARGEAQLASQEGRGGALRAGWRRLRARASGAAGPRLRELDRRMPVQPRHLAAGLIVIVAGVAVATGGFGVVGGSDDGGGKRKHKPPVAVLNGTASSGLAASVEKQVVAPLDYRLGPVTNTQSSFPATVVMYAPGREAPAKVLADAVAPQLGETQAGPMTEEIRTLARDAPLALVIGLDDADFKPSG